MTNKKITKNYVSIDNCTSKELKKNKIPAQCRARLIIKTYGSQKKNCKCRRHPTKFLLRTFCKKCMFILRSTSKLRTRLTPRCRLSRHSTSVTQPRSYVALSERLKNCKPHLRKNVAYEAGSLLQEESRISERTNDKTRACTCRIVSKPLRRKCSLRNLRVRLLKKKLHIECSFGKHRNKSVLKSVNRNLKSCMQREHSGSRMTSRRELKIKFRIIELHTLLRRYSARQRRSGDTLTKRFSAVESHLQKPAHSISEQQPEDLASERSSDPMFGKQVIEPKQVFTNERTSEKKEIPAGQRTSRRSQKRSAIPEDSNPTVEQQTPGRRLQQCSCGVATRDSLSRSSQRSLPRMLSHLSVDEDSRKARKTRGWNTWAIARHKVGPKRFIRVCFRELILFLLFLALLTLILIDLDFRKYIRCKLIMDSFTKTLYKTNLTSVNSTGKIYYTMENIPDLWAYLTHHFAPLITLYHVKNTDKSKSKGNLAPLIKSSITMGPARIRQVRVVNSSCAVPDVFSDWYKFCYTYFNYKYEDKKSFGPSENKEWSWRKTDQVLYYFGKMAMYSPHGYYTQIPSHYDAAKVLLADLEKRRWIDRATRAVFIDFTVYSPDVDLFSAVKLVMELPPSGGVFPSSRCYSMKLISPEDWMDLFKKPTVLKFLYLIVGVLFAAFILYFTLIVLWDVCYFGCSYLLTFWGFLDVSILFLIFGTLAMFCAKESYSKNVFSKLAEGAEKDKHMSSDIMIAISTVYSALLGILVILCWIKLLKFFAMFTRVSMMFTAVHQTSKELKTLLFMGSILMFGFAVCGHLFFGLQVEEFSSIGNSLFSVLSMSLGGLHFYESMNVGRPILAPLFLLFFMFTFVFTVWFTFIAAVLNGVEKAEDIIALSGPNGRFGSYECLHNSVVLFLTRCRCKRLSTYLRRKLRIKVLRMRQSLLLALLRKYGIHGLEIQLFLERHGLRYGYDVTFTELAHILADMKTKQYLLYKETVEHEKLFDQLDVFQMRLEIIEKELYDISVS
ncbi:polycystin-2-like isoform X2 [Rhodnius prolixus]|uniref:polycystin-2-like isoform X2 n=1 Tax=Rhodnius prolixus TaxID=13249 RepID=UPI003D189107